ncbi:hypothetical protein JCM11251_007251 [Rhodosporidiobolus azoricus]
MLRWEVQGDGEIDRMGLAVKGASGEADDLSAPLLESLRKEGEAYIRPSKEELRRMVGEDPRYLVKDGWACYGFNNQRYMIESTLLLAKISDRIPVIPDAIWARSCATNGKSCEENALLSYADRNEHPEALSCKWNEPGAVYKLGIENFLDLPFLRRTTAFLTFSEFFDLYDLPSSAYDQTEVWNATSYNPAGLTTATLPEAFFQNRTLSRVDRPPPASPPLSTNVATSSPDKLDVPVVEAALSSKAAWTLPVAKKALAKLGAQIEPMSDDELVKRLEQLGVVPLYTFSDEVLMNKAMARPSVELALRSKTHPLTTTLDSPPFASASIVYLQGNLHDQRKPGGVYFTTSSARDEFTKLVLGGIRAPAPIRAVGELLAQRMAQKVSGRRWLAAHLRRGDFVNIAWSPARDPIVHFNKTVSALSDGARQLAVHSSERIPLPNDPFYLATDESNSTSLDYYRSHGAVVLSDLLLPSDLDLLGPSSSYTDVLAVVEQQILSRSDFFVGSELSSTSGGAINDRLASGKEEWSWSLLRKNG